MSDLNLEAAKKERRERVRWFILRALDVARPQGCYLPSILDVIRGSVYRDATELEIKRELDYLADRKLIKLQVDPLEQWFAELDRYGVDVVEYAVPVEPGIARPKFGGA